MRAFAENRSGNVIVLKPGISFDSLGEAYDFCNMYSWEKGFGTIGDSILLNQVQSLICLQSKAPRYAHDAAEPKNISFGKGHWNNTYYVLATTNMKLRSGSVVG